MVRTTKALLIGATALGLALPGLVRAQDKPAPAATADTDEQTKPYVPPSVRKSVEVGNYYFR
ncbi:MAG: hypothetical protein DMG25_16310 [Acidobacteria bacterium]|nr:MAG: hypothetical protein DMG25_16310 [Acidobacteriota bacterium]